MNIVIRWQRRWLKVQQTSGHPRVSLNMGPQPWGLLDLAFVARRKLRRNHRGRPCSI